MKIGSFTNLYHDVSGDVFVLDSHSLIIKNFTYDGTAPDAFFTAGMEGDLPHGAPDAVLSFPFTGEHYDYQAGLKYLQMTNNIFKIHYSPIFPCQNPLKIKFEETSWSLPGRACCETGEV